MAVRRSFAGARDRVTVREIARVVDVAPSTVSRALNGKGGVSDSLRRKIRETAAELRRQAGVEAGRAVTFVADVRASSDLEWVTTSPFYMEILAGAEEAARECGFGFRLVFARSEEDVASLLAAPAGAPLVWLGYESGPRWQEALEAAPSPIVLLDHYLPGAGRDGVVSDNLGGARALAFHIVALGHRRVVILKQDLGSAAAWERALGFQSALAEGGLGQDDVVVIAAKPTFDGGYASFEGVIESGATAVLCSNDLMALGVIRAATEAGVAVPGELSIAGFDDLSQAQQVTPGLTTVHVRKRQLGREAVRRLAARVEYRIAPEDAARIVVPVSLVVRGSTAPPPARSGEKR